MQEEKRPWTPQGKNWAQTTQCKPYLTCWQTSCFSIPSPIARSPVGSGTLVSMCTVMYTDIHPHSQTHTHILAHQAPSLLFSHPSGAGNKAQVFTRGILASPWRLNDFMVEAILSSQQNKTKVLFGLSSPGYTHCSVSQGVLISTRIFE